jgi:ATP-binding cassette subfamily F protein 3
VKPALSTTGLSKHFGAFKAASEVTLSFPEGARHALIGPNGAGKTTLLKTILGDKSALDGRVRLGASVQMGYLAQAQAGLDPDETVLDAILDIKNLPMTQARSFLGQFLFSGDDVFREIRTLSGGQRSRVALARLTLLGSNLLLLDEPTNHLDLASQEVLEDVLRQFPGTILLVSHDRYLVQALATHIWRVAGDELRVYKGNYEEYLRLRAAETESKAEVKVETEVGGPTESDRERVREERRQRKAAERLAEQAAALETQIHGLEAELATLSAQLEAASVAGDVSRIQRLGVAYQEIDTELHQLMAEWAEMA